MTAATQALKVCVSLTIGDSSMKPENMVVKTPLGVALCMTMTLACATVQAQTVMPETPAAAASTAPPAESVATVPQFSNSTNNSEMNTVVVTGSRVKRSVIDSTAPIDVISGDTLEKLGAKDVTEALDKLVPSFNLPSSPGQDQSSIVRAANLRGLNGDQTLVLVDGKRRHVSAVVNAFGQINKGSEPVDLNFIPISAIDHIEVLRDGAAALYGSDAIAGVINIILKKSAYGGSFTGKAGGYSFKDGFTQRESFNQGFSIGDGGFLNVTAEYLNQRHTDNGNVTQPQNNTGPNGSPSFYYGLDYNGTSNPARFDPRDATAYGQHRIQQGLGDQHAVNAEYNLGLPVFGGAAQLYSFSTYGYRVGIGYENFRYANGSTDPVFCPNGTGPANNPYCQIAPNGFEPNEVITENDFSTTLGLKGDNLLGWAWDVSSTYGKDDASVGTQNTINATLGPNSPTKFYNGSWIATEFTNTVDVSHPFNVGLAAPLNVALGGEYRNESYTVKPGEIGSYAYGPGNVCATGGPTASPYCTFVGPDGKTRTPNAGAQSYNGFSPAQSGRDYRDSFATYVDFETKPLPKWDTGIAARFEHYDSFGNAVIGKFSTRYQVVKDFAVRGTVSNGFRAPALGQSLFASSSTFFQAGQAYDAVTAPVNSPLAIAFGAKPLKAEKSTNFSLGFVATPLRHLDITVDAYRIYVRNRISVTENIGPGLLPGTDSTGTPVVSYLLPPGVNVSNIQYFGNLVSTRTQGIDAVINYTTNFHQYGLFRWTLAANWNQTKITSVAANPSVYTQPLGPDGISVEQANPGFNNVFDPSQVGYLTLATPRTKQVVGINWLKGPFSVNFRATRYGSIANISSQTVDGSRYIKLTPKAIFDLYASYDVTDNVNVGLGADNLLNTRPTTQIPDRQSPSVSGPQGGGKYADSGSAPYGTYGGFYYLQLTVHWD